MLPDQGLRFNVRRPAREAAQHLYDRGIAPIPLCGKDPPPRFPLARYFVQMPTEAELDQFFPTGAENVGAVMGDVSGGVCVRDFDSRASFDRWASEHPDLAGTLPITRTARGSHVWCYPDPPDLRAVAGGSAWLKYPDGELRVERCYVVCPFSIHPDTGTAYEWASPLDGLTFVADLSAAGLVPDCTQEIDKGLGAAPSAGVPRGFLEVPPDVQSAIRLTLPEQFGERHDRIFQFVRALRGMAEFSGKTADDAESVFRLWWQEALPTIRTKNWAESRRDFRGAWRLVRSPWGSGSVYRAFVDAQGDGMNQLADACRRIHAGNGGQPFFLAGRKAAELLHRSHRTVAYWLARLVERGQLEIIEKGTHENMLGTIYRYTGD